MQRAPTASHDVDGIMPTRRRRSQFASRSRRRTRVPAKQHCLLCVRARFRATVRNVLTETVANAFTDSALFCRPTAGNALQHPGSDG